MKLFVTTLLFATTLFSAKLLDINTYSKDTHSELVISLNAPYKDKVVNHKEKKNNYILFRNITVESPKEVAKENKIFKFVRVFPDERGLLLKIKEKERKLDFDIERSKDNYTIKIKIKPKNSYQLGNYKVEPQVGENVQDLEKNYLIAAGFVAILLLVWIMAKIFGKNAGNGALFIKSGKNSYKIDVTVQKVIDAQNKIVEIRFANTVYIVLIGQNNMLLERFSDKEKSTQNKFEADLKKSQKRLDSLIK